MVSSAGSGQALKGKELGKESGEGEVRYNPVSCGQALKGKDLVKESGKIEVTDNPAGGGEALKGEELGKESGKGEFKHNPVGKGQDLKGKEPGKDSGKGKVRENPVGEGDRQRLMVLLDLLKESAAEPDHEGEDQKGDEEGEQITPKEHKLPPLKTKKMQTEDNLVEILKMKVCVLVFDCYDIIFVDINLMHLLFPHQNNTAADGGDITLTDD